MIFNPKLNTSYAAGIGYLVFAPGKEPELLLVLQKEGKAHQNKDGSIFVEPRAWKMPMGNFDPTQDRDLVDTALREWREKTGLSIERTQIIPLLSHTSNIPSLRSSFVRHHAEFFLVLSKQVPKQISGANLNLWIEKVEWFPLSKLPTIRKKEKPDKAIMRGHHRRLETLLDASANFFRELYYSTI